jgi:hypothetical protein
MRERVIARVESSASRREAAEHFEISASAAVRRATAHICFLPPAALRSGRLRLRHWTTSASTSRPAKWSASSASPARVNRPAPGSCLAFWHRIGARSGCSAGDGPVFRSRSPFAAFSSAISDGSSNRAGWRGLRQAGKRLHQILACIGSEDRARSYGRACGQHRNS